MPTVPDPPVPRALPTAMPQAPLTRRQLLMRRLPRALTLPVGAALLAACGRAVATTGPAAAATRTAKPSATASPVATTTASAAPVAGGTAQWSTYGTLSALIPILVTDTSTGLLVNFLFDPLVNFDAEYNPVPGLAEKWETSGDNMSWTFHLRKASWHDGQPFTSADVAFTVQAIMHPGYTGTRRSNYLQLVGASAYVKHLRALDKKLKAKTLTGAEYTAQAEAAWRGWIARSAVETPDPQTVVFHLTEVFAPFLTNVGGAAPIPQHLLKDRLGAAMVTSRFGTSPVGTGPFRFGGGNLKDHVTVNRWDGYWDGRAWLDAVATKVIPEVSTAEAALQSKQLDFSSIQPQDAARFKKIPFLDVLTSPTFSYEYMAYHVGNPLFSDRNVRIAICHAVPKEQIVKTLLYGYGGVAWTHGSPARWDYNPNVVKYTYDPKKALSLLDAAGWTKNGAGKLMKDGKPFKFTISVNTGSGLPQKATVIIQQALNEIGMEVSVRKYDWATFVNKVLNVNNFDAAVVGWSLGPDPDSYSIWTTHGALNTGGWSNAEVDKLEREGRTTIDHAARKKIYQQIEAILAQDQPYLFLYYQDAIDGLNKRLRGPIAATPRGLTWNIDKWWIPRTEQGGPARVSG